MKRGHLSCNEILVQHFELMATLACYTSPWFMFIFLLRCDQKQSHWDAWEEVVSSGPKGTLQWFICGENMIRCQARLLRKVSGSAAFPRCVLEVNWAFYPCSAAWYTSQIITTAMNKGHLCHCSILNSREICNNPKHRTFFPFLLSCSCHTHIWPISGVDCLTWCVAVHLGLLGFYSMWIQTQTREKHSKSTTSSTALYQSQQTICVKVP